MSSIRNAMKLRSLTSQLFLAIGAGLLIAISIVAALALKSTHEEIDEVYDSQMISSADLLWMISHDAHPPGQIRLDELSVSPKDRQALNEYARWRSFRVWHDDRIIISSDNIAGMPPPNLKGGFHNLSIDGQHWRFYTLNKGNNTIVEVGEKMAARADIVQSIIGDLVWPFMIALPLVLLAVWFGIKRGLRDLNRFSGDLSERSARDLARIETETTPAEIVPLAQSINRLLGNLESSLEQERLFTDNAAHELRTPLATLAVQADVILNARTETERQQTAAELSKGVKRAARLLDQLLTLARVHHVPVERAPVNPYALCAEAISDVYPRAHAKGIEISLSGDEHLSLLSQKALLMTIISNLLDNAVKYTPENGKIEVHVAATQSNATITITDTGAGIAEEEREKVFGRFYRVKGTVESGSGLGLSIVRTCAELIRAKVELRPAKLQYACHVKAYGGP
jgi:signal transduction histidine kinase